MHWWCCSLVLNHRSQINQVDKGNNKFDVMVSQFVTESVAICTGCRDWWQKVSQFVTTSKYAIWWHILYIYESLPKFYGTFNKIKLLVPKKYKLAIYDAYVYSKLRYGIEIYGSLNVTLKKRLQIVSNKLLKILFCMSPFHSTNQLHKGLYILQINDVYKASVLKFVFLCVNHTPLSIFDQYYKRRRDQHSRSLRDLHNLHVPDGYSAIALSST